MTVSRTFEVIDVIYVFLVNMDLTVTRIVRSAVARASMTRVPSVKLVTSVIHVTVCVNLVVLMTRADSMMAIAWKVAKNISLV